MTRSASAGSSSATSRALLRQARAVAAAAAEKKADDVVIIDLRGRTGYTDMLVLATGASTRQVSAIAEHIERYVKHTAGSRLLGLEGLPEARWVLLDWGHIVCHVFVEEVRAFYDIEGMWMDAPRLSLTPRKRSKTKQDSEEPTHAVGGS